MKTEASEGKPARNEDRANQPIHTLVLQGHMPSKKNNLRPRAPGRGGKGLMNSREVWAMMLGFELQARAIWASKPTIETAHISAVFAVPHGLGDADGKYTTLQDVLVKSGVIRDDNIARVPGHQVDCVLAESESVTVTILDLGPMLTAKQRRKQAKV